ncbi:hypothetical protein EOM81_12380 [bacterium]|nr:hypothetical protein [bacterium]
MTESTTTLSFRVKDAELKWRLRIAAGKAKTTVGELVEKLLIEGLNRLDAVQGADDATNS